MVFVTVGTHEQQFNRLVKAIDDLVANGLIEDDEIIIQSGYSTFVPEHCQWKPFLNPHEMKFYMQTADVVVTHGGPSSFLEAMAVGKMPVVVPRQSRYGEHVNDHQLEFVREIAARKGGILPVYDVDSIVSAIEKARLVKDAGKLNTHNASFCADLEQLIKDL